MTGLAEGKSIITDLKEDQKVPLESLSELTGFPIEFIKKELLLGEQELSLAELRGHMLRYLDETSAAISKES
ncbi:MAG: hypothetical protein HN509_08890 [Halobacteriovoraceae bacterium]|jgi:hypothetical protein|nr:hypothetical protein [Halobacteriovoraceae bacterium]MBT5093088.1 hypothetical protein [Halobacteriovoraceae bacterium]